MLYRTAGAWGAGKGSNLTPAEVDGNFYELRNDLDNVIANPPDAVGIANIEASGLNWVVTLTNGTELAPVPIPVPVFRFRGEWAAFTIYEQLDTFTVVGEGLYVALVDHTSAATFDPDATSGSPPETVYQQIFPADLTATLDSLLDVTITGTGSPATPGDDDFIAYNLALGEWTNRTPTEVTALLDEMVGDTGSPGGGVKGLVPAPADGDAAAGKYLDASGIWSVPPTVGFLDDLGDVDTTGAVVGDVLKYQGSPPLWQPSSVPGALDDLSDVNAPSPANGDVLQFNGAEWVDAAGSAISDLGDATLPLASASLLEISEASGSPATYTSKKITVADFFTDATLTDATLSGTTTLPGLGQITTNGELAIGGSASGLLGVFGTYTTATSTLTQITATLASSGTSTQIGFNLSPTFSPSGASLTTVQSVGASPALSGSALNISVLQGIAVVPRILAGYTGTVASSRGLQVNDVSITGTGLVTDSNEFYAGTITHGNGLTTGSNTNRQFYALGITSSAAGGTLNNRGFELVVPSGGASSGTANNRGLYITSNGGTASGGTVNNHAIYNDSTANVYLSAGNVGIQVTTPTIALDVGGRIRAKVYTVATLPAAGTQGARAYVSDSNATLTAGIGAVVVGGGANPVPVEDDGTNWRIG